MSTPRKLLLAQGLAALPVGAAVQAQDAAPSLEEVVVSASGFGQEVKNAPVSISVITRDQRADRSYLDLAETLQDVESISVHGATGKTGGLSISISISIMPRDHTLILIDGRWQNVADDVTPNGFGDAMTSLMPSVLTIERVEVIRGPMSTLYGSDAMGGVVNIITHKVAREWTGQVSLEAGIPQGSDWGSMQKISLYGSGPPERERPWVAAAEQHPSPTRCRSSRAGTPWVARLTLTPNRSHDIWLDAEQGRNWYANDKCQLGNVGYLCGNANNGSGYLDHVRFNRDPVAARHTARLGYGTLEPSLMPQHHPDEGLHHSDRRAPGRQCQPRGRCRTQARDDQYRL